MSISIESWSDEKIEYAYGLAQRAQMEGWQAFADAGMRAARARDARLLRALEACAESTERLSESQTGQVRRQSSTPFAEQRAHTEVQLFREAFRLADAGNPIENLCWIYGAAAWLCGYTFQTSNY